MPSVDLTQVSPLEVPSLIAMLPAALSWQLRPTTPALPSNTFLVSSSFHAQNRFRGGPSSRKERERQRPVSRVPVVLAGIPMGGCFPASLPPPLNPVQSKPPHPPLLTSTARDSTAQRSSPAASVRPCPSFSVYSRPCRAGQTTKVPTHRGRVVSNPDSTPPSLTR